MIAIENRFRIHQALIFIFPSNPDEKSFSEL